MRIRVNDVYLNVEQQSGDSSPLVLLHGFTGSTEVWTALRMCLGSNHHVIAIDLLGHGSSDSPKDPRRYSMDNTVEDLYAVFDYLDLRSVNLLGYSMGGRVALHLAISQPSRLGSLILESTSPGIEDECDRSDRLKSDGELADLLQRDGIDSFVDRWEAQPLFASQAQLPAETRARLRHQRLSSNPRGLANNLRGAGAATQPALYDQLPQLTVPTLLIAGELDTKYGELVRHMHSLLPNSTLAVIPNAGHTVHLEQPAAFQRCVLDFLATHNSQLTTHNSQLTTHNSQLITHNS